MHLTGSKINRGAKANRRAGLKGGGGKKREEEMEGKPQGREKGKTSISLFECEFSD